VALAGAGVGSAVAAGREGATGDAPGCGGAGSSLAGLEDMSGAAVMAGSGGAAVEVGVGAGTSAPEVAVGSGAAAGCEAGAVCVDDIV
jgi:hypothetical protein